MIRSFLRQGTIPMAPPLIFKIQQTREITRTGLGLGRWNPETRVSSARTSVDIRTYDSQLPFQPSILSFIRSKNQLVFGSEDDLTTSWNIIQRTFTNFYNSRHSVASSACALKVNDIDSRDLETPAIVEANAPPFTSAKEKRLA
ncbi:hypothetical protein ACKAV7_004586 [Fusarium commune]